MLPRFYSVRFTPLGPSGHHVLAKLILVLALANALYLAYHFEPVWRLKALEEQSYQRTLKHTSARVRYLHGDFRRGTKLPPVGEMFTPILMPVCARPELLSTVMSRLERVWGIEKTLIVLSIDDCGRTARESVEEVLARHGQGASNLTFITLDHPKKFFGLPSWTERDDYLAAANIRSLLTFAFEHLQAAHAIVLESDILPSLDFYLYHRWAYRHFFATPHSFFTYPSAYSHTYRFATGRDAPSPVLMVRAYQHDSRPPGTAHHGTPLSIQTNTTYKLAADHAKFPTYGSSFSRANWSWMKARWTWFDGWDNHFAELVRKHDLSVVVPLLSRARVLGMQGINFSVDENDEEELASWRDVYMIENEEEASRYHEGYGPQMYEGRRPEMRWEYEGASSACQATCLPSSRMIEILSQIIGTVIAGCLVELSATRRAVVRPCFTGCPPSTRHCCAALCCIDRDEYEVLCEDERESPEQLEEDERNHERVFHRGSAAERSTEHSEDSARMAGNRRREPGRKEPMRVNGSKAYGTMETDHSRRQ